MPTLTIQDETTAGDRIDAITLEFLTEETTIRELIRERVYQEVKDYNTQLGGVFRGLVQPTESERALNGFKLARERTVDWQEQFERACDAFECTEFLILVDDRQAERLDESLTLTPATRVSFLKLVPLVGG